jgi:hypothetical protein
MIPVFSPDGAKKLDADKLRLVFDDDFTKDPAIIASFQTAILGWAPKLGIEINNLDVGRPPGTNDYRLVIGNGVNAREPEKTLERSYVGPGGGYFFRTKSNAAVFAHEFGHLMGLADRYYEGYQYTPDLPKEEKEGDNVTVPMAKSLFIKDGDPADPEADYNPATNLMSSTPAEWTISTAQRQSILDGKSEPQLARNVIGIFRANDNVSSVYHLPASMYLDKDGRFYTDDPPPPKPLVGYTLSISKGGAPVAVPRSAKTREFEVKILWNRLKPRTFLGIFDVSVTHGGKKHKGGRVRADGPKIHQPMMRLIAKLAGG